MRVRIAALRLSTLLIVAFALVWLATLFWMFQHSLGASGAPARSGDIYIVRLQHGSLQIRQTTRLGIIPVEVRRPRWKIERTDRVAFALRPRLSRDNSLNPFIAQTTLHLPLWIPIAALALIMAILLRWRSSPRAHHCPSCGYSLAGLPSTTCPECGTASGSPPPCAAIEGRESRSGS